jgi:hypothetical protein
MGEGLLVRVQADALTGRWVASTLEAFGWKRPRDEGRTFSFPPKIFNRTR